MASIPAFDPREAALRRRKRIALALLGIAGAVLVVATWLEAAHPHWGYSLLASMAEAALVGGLADWFAVVALFRHPLGQRWIPHTAIIPAKKDAIGSNLADFICTNFLARQQVLDRLRAFDVAGRMAARLADPEHARALGERITQAVPHLLHLINSEQLHRFIHDAAHRRLQRVDLSGLASVGLHQLTADGRHEGLVDGALSYIRDALQSPEMHRRISERAAREVWGILRYARLDAVIADRIADKLVSGFTDLVTEMSTDRRHEMRLRLDAELQTLIERLRSDEAFRERVNAFRDRMLAESELGPYLRSLWDDVIAWLHEDVARPDSAVRARIAHAAQELGSSLLGNAAMRDWINTSVIETLEPMIDPMRDRARAFIAERVGRWSTEELTRELELSIGGDLQYIRYNGTAIGALIGGLLFLVMQAVHRLAAG
ncbi:MAG TPA: DUF445 domain-containing protein [Lysobacter sp.]